MTAPSSPQESHVEALKQLGMSQAEATKVSDDAKAKGINLGGLLTKLIPAILSVVTNPDVKNLIDLIQGLAGGAQTPQTPSK